MAVTTVVGNDLFTIGPGQSIDYRYWWGANEQQGSGIGVGFASFATDPRWLGTLYTSNQGMIASVYMVSIGLPDLNRTSWVYTVTVTNPGEYAVAFKLLVLVQTPP